MLQTPADPMHVLDGGITPHMLSSTSFEIKDFIEQHTDTSDPKGIKLCAKRVQSVRQAWISNLMELGKQHDICGLRFSQPAALTVTQGLEPQTQSRKPLKLKAWEYGYITQVPINMWVT